jgi:hypothetical protein
MRLSGALFLVRGFAFRKSRLGQDRLSNVLESGTVRVSERALCGLQHIVSTDKIVPFLAG